MKMRESHRAQGADGMLSSLQYLPAVLDPAPIISIVESKNSSLTCCYKVKFIREKLFISLVQPV